MSPNFLLFHMSYIRVTFRKSAKKDFETLRAFTKDAKYDNGRNLNWAVFNKYPQLKIYFDKNKQYKIKNKKALHYFIYEAHRSKQIDMNRALMQHKKCWEKIAPYYFPLVDHLFSGRKWPQGKYVAFGTIWGMYPRFLEDKTFQVPFWHRIPRYIPVVIAHELLHFMFYDYFYSHYPKYKNHKYDFKVWDISEAFNVLIQNSPKWLRVFKQKCVSYPEHKQLIQKMNGIWRGKQDIDYLLKRILQS